MDKKIFLTLRDMDDEEYYCVKKVELNSTLEEKIKNELVAIYQEQGMDDLATVLDIIDDVFQKLKEEVDKNG